MTKRPQTRSVEEVGSNSGGVSTDQSVAGPSMLGIGNPNVGYLPLCQRPSPPYIKPSCRQIVWASCFVPVGCHDSLPTTVRRQQMSTLGPPAPRAGETLNPGFRAATSGRWAFVGSHMGLWHTSAGRVSRCASGPARELCSPVQCDATWPQRSDRPGVQRLACGTAGQPSECVWQLRGSKRSSRGGHRISTRRVAVCSLASTLAPVYSWGSSLTEPLARILVRIVGRVPLRVGRFWKSHAEWGNRDQRHTSAALLRKAFIPQGPV